MPKENRSRPNDLATAKGLEQKYFVLKPGKDSPYGVASRAAMKAYALSISSTNQDLADMLWAWRLRIERILAGGTGNSEVAEVAKREGGISKAKGRRE